MIDFIDKTDTQDGTLINRSALMNMQGFYDRTLTFADGQMIVTDSDGQMSIFTVEDDGSITETFTGEKTIVQNTLFNNNGTIVTVVR